MLDDAAIYAYRFLPDQNAAVERAEDYVASNSRYASSVEVLSDSRSITLQLNTRTRIFFAELFNIDAGIPLRIFSSAAGTPFDVFIAIDSGNYLAPDIRNGSAWGDQGWQAAYFFSTINPPFDQTGPLDARLATQQCFNPAFSALKSLALLTYNHICSFSSNSVGVGIYPGLGAMDIIREVQPAGYVLENGAEARFVAFSGNSVLCAAAAENEPNFRQYNFPVLNAPAAAPLRRVIPGEWRINPAYQPFFTVADVVWSRAVSRNQPGDIIQVFEALRANLIGAAGIRQRQGLTGPARKMAIIFAGDLPWTAFQLRFPHQQVKAAIASQLSKLKRDLEAYRFNLKIYYVFFRHYGNRGVSLNDAQQLNDFFNSDRRLGENLEFQVLYAENAAAVSKELLGAVLLDKKTAVLSQ